MQDALTPHGSPLALVADDRDERTRWLVRLLEDAGYAVLRERLGRHALARAQIARPDAIILGAELSDIPGIDVCRALRGDPQVGGPPILMVMGQPVSRDQRLQALRAGAWECIAPPHDAEEILLKLHTFIGARRDADQARSEGLLDPPTGLYNRLGLARRARELGSQAAREHAALACVVVALDPDPAVLAASVEGLRNAIRRSDILGRLGPTEFAVLAPGTDAPGALTLAERLARVVEQAAPDHYPRCGYEAVGDLAQSPIDPVQLLVHAAAAVRVGRAEASGRGWIRRFSDEDDPPG